MSEDLRAETAWAVEKLCEVAERLGRALEDTPAPREIVFYSQREPAWRDVVYAGNLTFGQAGCYVTCVAMIASLAGYDHTPPQVAQNLRAAGCFDGALLTYPEWIPTVYTRLRWDGALDWRKRPADLLQLRSELEAGPVIVEVEFRPGGTTPPQDQHFVVAEMFTADGRDLVIADPWDGARTRLMQRYAMAGWGLARSVYGARLLRVV